MPKFKIGDLIQHRASGERGLVTNLYPQYEKKELLIVTLIDVIIPEKYEIEYGIDKTAKIEVKSVDLVYDKVEEKSDCGQGGDGGVGGESPRIHFSSAGEAHEWKITKNYRYK